MKAFIIVDIQNDFCPGGALPVPEGDRIIPAVNRIKKKFEIVVATRDWHPRGHVSFASSHPGKKPGDTVVADGVEQILWPEHCIQCTEGAEFVLDLNMEKVDRVFLKGTHPRIDSYSGFFDNGRRQSTGMADYLRDQGVGQVFIAGLATDYCVKYTALDAIQLGLRTFVVIDATRGIEAREGDTSRAVEEMVRAGVRMISAADV